MAQTININDIPYISYAVKYPDTNKLGVEDLFIDANDTVLEQTRGVLAGNVHSLNGKSIPMGGGDNTSLNSKISTLFEMYDKTEFNNFVETTEANISRIDNTIETKCIKGISDLNKASTNALHNATTAIYKEFRTKDHSAVTRITSLEDSRCKNEETLQALVYSRKEMQTIVGDLQRAYNEERISLMETKINNLGVKECAIKDALDIFKSIIESNDIVILHNNRKQELVTAISNIEG